MKSLLGDIDVAREYFEAFLPDSIKKVVDLSRLEHSSHSFISEELKETQADIVFRCPLLEEYGEQELYLCLLVEHRSTKYNYVSIQLGGYIFDAYRKQLKNRELPLIPVIPFLYYHGSEAWKPPVMHDLFELVPPSIKDFIPLFHFIFENIQNYNDEQIRQLGSGLFTSALLTQKYADRPDLLLDRFRQIFSILGSWKGRNLFNTLIVYYIELVEIEKEELNLLVEQIPKVMRTEFVSLADKLREEGWEEGIEKGMEEGMEKGIEKGMEKGIEEGMEKGMEEGMEKGMERKNWTATENMLRKGFEVSVICDVLDVAPEFVEQVKNEMTNSDA